MKNEVHGSATFYLVHKTEMDEEEFQIKFHPENIVAIKLQMVTSDGKIHEVDAVYTEELNWIEYIKREASEQKPTDPTQQ